MENNNVIDVLYYNKEYLEIVYSADTYIEQLLDIAHIDNYQHLEDIISVKFPRCLHVAGKHFNISHEYLSLTQDDIDYS